MTADPIYAFGPFQIDVTNARLKRDGAIVALGDRSFRVLAHLVAHPRATIAKEELVVAGWGDVAVSDNSLEQAISGLRRALGATEEGGSYIETIPRQGYRLNATVTRQVARRSPEEIDALLAPHRAWIDGRAALESLQRQQIVRATSVFEQALEHMPDYPAAHVGLANACALQFEGSRAGDAPDQGALARAVHHAREACRLDADYAEGWATLGFVLERTRNHADALAACRRAIALEPDNWRHHLRLSSVAWGEERLRAARRTLALLPGCPLAHWLAATVLVARDRLDDAARELTAGIGDFSGAGPGTRFSAVALHWLRGLIRLAREDPAQAIADFETELSLEPQDHLYSRECCANTWYAIGVLRMRQHRIQDAAAALDEALQRAPHHAVALVTRAAVAGHAPVQASRPRSGDPRFFDAVIAAAACHVLDGDHAAAARLVDTSLAQTADTNAGWLLPVEPLLNVAARPGVWEAALARLRARTA